jgi:AcrR family transcriptional regulator
VTVTENRARRPRADAERNRERLLAVAINAFAKSAEVPLEEIARRANVGIGTLYRHFPTRAALIEAAYRHEVAQLCAPVVRSTLAPEAALEAWMERFIQYVATKRGMIEALRSVVAADSALYAHTREQIVTALRTLLSEAAASGAIRADANAEDVLRALQGVWQVTSEPEWQDKARRLLNLLMDGLRYGAPGARANALRRRETGHPARQMRRARGVPRNS